MSQHRVTSKVFTISVLIIEAILICFIIYVLVVERENPQFICSHQLALYMNFMRHGSAMILIGLIMITAILLAGFRKIDKKSAALIAFNLLVIFIGNELIDVFMIVCNES